LVDELQKGLAKSVIEKYAEKLLSMPKTLYDCLKIDLDEAFDKYLANAYGKFSKAKTLLYTDKPRSIRDFLVTPRLEYKSGERVSVSTINDIIEIDQFILIKGSGGIGKSMLMKHLFLSELDENGLIPIFFELRNLNDLADDYDLTDVLFREIYILGNPLAKRAVEYALSQGLFLFLLDGYDEIKSERTVGFIKRLNEYCDKYSENFFIISSRPQGDFVEFVRFSVLSTCGLDKDQAIELVQKIDYDHSSKKRFIDALDSYLYETHISFASNPLLLTMMFLTYSDWAQIPAQIHLFYSHTFDTLLLKHDARKEGYIRELKSGVSSEALKKIFAQLCFITYFNEKNEFTHSELVAVLQKVKQNLNNSKTDFAQFDADNYICDLSNAVSMLYKEGRHYRFIHRSFQEYFAAVFLREQFDDNMQMFGVRLITKDPIRARSDSVFTMLYDMAQEKCEKNILLPLYKEFEKDYIDGSKYDFYLHKLDPYMSFSMSNSGVRRLTWYQSDSIVYLASDFIDLELSEAPHAIEAENKLRDYISESDKFVKHVNIDKLDSVAYELFKETWIGLTISHILAERERLEDKYSLIINDEYDFFEL